MGTTFNDSAQELRIYVVLNLLEPPRLLMREADSKELHCFFAFPLPPQVAVFCLGDTMKCDERMAIDVFLDSETEPCRLGYVNKNSNCVCLEPKWPSDFLERSHILHERDKMARLVLRPESDLKNESNKVFTKVSPESLALLETRQLVVQLSKDIPACLKGNQDTSPKRPVTKLESAEGASKRKKRRSADGNNNNRFVQTRLETSISKLLTEKKEMQVKDISPSKAGAEVNNEKKPADWPSGRWGHSLCSLGDNKSVIIGGQGENYQMVKDSIYLLNCDSNTWEARVSKKGGSDRRMGHTATYDPEKNVVYVFGGSKNKRWFSDVHVLDLNTWQWEDIKAVGKAPKRTYHSALLFHRELFIFGGVFPNADPQPDGCSNELFIFNTGTNIWYEPIVTGAIPSSRSGHTMLLYDETKAVIFGGWDAPKCFNDVYLLDLVLMEFSCPEVSGQKPTARSWHSSSLLEGNRLLIHGGFDGSSDQVLGDSFIFDIDKLTWVKVALRPEISLRVGHVMFRKETTDNEEDVIVFGGGDNIGSFFDDLLTVKIVTK